MTQEDRDFEQLLTDLVKLKNDLAGLHSRFLKYMRGDDITHQDKYWTGFNHAIFKAAKTSLDMLKI
jgi:hypothetical protein